MLRATGFSNADSSLELQRLGRAQTIVATLAERHDRAEGVISDLVQVPSIQGSIQAASDATHRKAEDRIRTELAEAIKGTE